MVSHELRAPLTSIKGSTATVFGAVPVPPQAELLQFLRIIDGQADHMRGLIANGVAMHKPSYPTEDPVEKCFEQITSRFDQYLSRLHNQENTQRGLLIMDESKYQRRLRTLLAHYRTAGHRWGRLRNFADVPFFSDSKATRLLQLADLVSWAIFRRYERGDTRHLDRIINRFDSEGGPLHGLIHLIGSHRTCMCPACLSRHSS